MFEIASYCNFSYTFSFEPESTVRGAITKIFKENFLGAWSCWSAVDTTTQDSWFDDFKVLSDILYE
jgi:hypothetical protein